MLKLTVNEMIKRIQKGITFEATASDGSFYLKIDEYTPYVCAAIHHGNTLRADLKSRIALSESESCPSIFRLERSDPEPGSE